MRMEDGTDGIGTSNQRELTCSGVPEESFHFRQRHRLSHAREFAAAFEAKVRKTRGPITIFTLPNELGHCRLGLSVGSRVGNAVMRNRIKRLLREAFRLEQHELAAIGGYDLVVSVRPHAGGRTLPLPQYRKMMVELVREADAEWGRRRRRLAAPEANG
jgi:ribonuclease P protein component